MLSSSTGKRASIRVYSVIAEKRYLKCTWLGLGASIDQENGIELAVYKCSLSTPALCLHWPLAN